MNKIMRYIKQCTAMIMALLLVLDTFVVTTIANDNLIQQIDNNIFVQGTDSFGNMLSDVINETTEEQRNNNGCNIFSVVVGEDDLCENEALVSFETIRDCSIVVAVYDGAEEQLLASGKLEVYSGETAAIVEIEIDEMPEYFYLKAYLIDEESLRPLSTVYESPNYTQEMQEFFSMTVNDFDEDRVINFDSDESNNFAVYSEDVIVIEQKDSVIDIVEADEDNGKYVIKNAGEDITSLIAGDILAYEYDDGSVLIVKVGDKEVDGTTVVIYGDETSMEEVFDYVKIDASADTSEVIVDDSNLQEGVEYTGLVEVEETPDMQTYAIVDVNKKVGVSHEINIFEEEDENDGKKVKISGDIAASVDAKLKCYVTWSYQYVEVKLEYSVKIDISITGKLPEKAIKLVEFTLSPLPGVYIEFTPSFVVEVSGKIEFSEEFKGAVGFSADGDGNYNNLSSNPKFEPTIEIEGKFYVGLSLKPKVKIISKKLAKAEMEAKVGVELSVSKKWEKESDSQKHICERCLDGDINAVCEVSFELKFLNKEKYTFKVKLVDEKIKLKDFYFSEDYNEYGFGTCPNIQYKITVEVKDSNQEKILNATVNDIHSTGDKGYVTMYLLSGNYVIKAEKGDAQGKCELSVDDEAKKISLYIFEEGESDDGNNSDVNDEENSDGDTGENEEDNNSITNADKLSLGACHSGYITEDGDLYTWGDNYYGQLGDGTWEDKNTPTKIMVGVKQVIFGGWNSAAITEDGDLYTWGENYYGQLGDGTWEDKNTPMKIMEGVKQISLGERHSAAITEDGDLYTWGYNEYGQLGDGTWEDKYAPTKIMEGVKQVILGKDYSAALTEEGDLYIWGYNEYGQLGDGAWESKNAPTKIMEGVKQVILGNWHSAALTESEELYMWGDNVYGQLGDGTWESKNAPTKIMEGVKQVILGEHHSGALTEEGDLYIWGYNAWCQQGDGTWEPKNMPTKTMESVKQANLGYYHSMALTESGDLYTWGYNYYGQLGNGTWEDKYVPTKIMGGVKQVVLRDWHSAALTESGELYIWGDNDDGQLGDGTWEDKNTPIKIEIPSTETYSVLKASQTVAYSALSLAKNTDVNEQSYTNLTLNETYNFYVLKSSEADDLLISDNLLYVNQVISDKDGNLNISYVPKEVYDDTTLILVGMNEYNISDAIIIVNDLEYVGEEQFVDVAVTYEGIELVQDVDYCVLGDYLVTEAGEYIVKIEGMGKYIGLVSVPFKVKSGVMLGDANGDEKVDSQDAVLLKKHLAGYTDLGISEEACDVNKDGSVNSSDAVILLKYLAGYDVGI